jgi:hypothetical protein
MGSLERGDRNLTLRSVERFAERLHPRAIFERSSTAYR